MREDNRELLETVTEGLSGVTLRLTLEGEYTSHWKGISGKVAL